MQKRETIIGWCGLDGEAEEGKTVVFYLMDARYRNKGFATECVRELLRYAFEEMGYDRIDAGCGKSNVASYRVLQKAGFMQRGFYENGDPMFYVDAKMYMEQKIKTDCTDFS